MKMAPCPASGGSWQVPEVLGDGGLGEGPSFKKGLPPKMHFHRNTQNSIRAIPSPREHPERDRGARLIPIRLQTSKTAGLELSRAK